VTAIIGLAHSLGMAVVSEGVETATQHETLARLGSDACQGFYFARPMSASALEALIHDHPAGSNPHLPAATTANLHRPEIGANQAPATDTRGVA